MGAASIGYQAANATGLSAPFQKAAGASLGPMVGASGGANGTGYATPQGANILQGTNPSDVAASNATTANSIQSQQALLAALKNQQALQAQNYATGETQNLNAQLAANNGIGNQASAYNQTQRLGNQLANTASTSAQASLLGQQQNLGYQLGNANGVQNLSSALAAQQALSTQQQGTLSQYQNIANGTGPNPAQAALNQSTGQNVANQAALMAGQRGAGSNVGLIARQAAQQGAATQQQAVGQGATLQAQQQLNALSGLTAQQQAIGATQQNAANIAAQQIGMQQTALNTAQNSATGITAQQQAQQQALAGQANQQVSQQQAAQQALNAQTNTLANQQINQTNANAQTAQGQQQILQNSLAAQNNANVSSQGNVNSGNATLANANIQNQGKIIGGLGQAIGVAAGLAQGGMVHKFADGGMTDPSMPMVAQPPQIMPQEPAGGSSSGPISVFGKLLSQAGSAGGAGAIAAASKGGLAEAGGKVIAKSSDQKAIKKGNSYSNDKIPAYLSEKEIVLPRTVTQSADPVKSAADFVAKVLGKNGGRLSHA